MVKREAHPLLSKATFVVQASIRPAGGTYGSPQTLSEPSTNAFSGGIASDGAGEAIAIWTQDQEPEKPVVRYAVRAPAGTFAPAQSLSLPGVASEQPAVTMNAGGEAVAVRLETDGTEFQYALRPAGGSFGTPVTVKAAAGSTVDALQPVLDAQGDLILSWDEEEEVSGTYFGRIEAAVRPAGQPLGPAVTLSEPGAHDFLPQAALDAHGDATLVWVQDQETGKTSSYTVLARTLSAGGTKGALQVLSAAGEFPEYPHITADAAGEATAVWNRETRVETTTPATTEADILPAAGTSFQAPVILDSTPGTTPDQSAIAGNENGETLVVWSHDPAAGSEQVDETLRTPGGSFTAPLVISAPGTGAASPSVAIDAAGDAVAAWLAFGAGNITLAGRELRPARRAHSREHAESDVGSHHVQRREHRSRAHRLTRVGKTKLAKLLKAGSLKVTLTLSAAAAGRIELLLAAKAARALGFHVSRHARTVAIGAASVKLATGGATTITVKLAASARRTLRRDRRPITLTVTAPGPRRHRLRRGRPARHDHAALAPGGRPRSQRGREIALRSSSFPIFERPLMSRRRASASSSLRVFASPVRTLFASCASAVRVAFGRCLSVCLLFAALWAFLTFRRAAAVCFAVAIGNLLSRWPPATRHGRMSNHPDCVAGPPRACDTRHRSRQGGYQWPSRPKRSARRRRKGARTRKRNEAKDAGNDARLSARNERRARRLRSEVRRRGGEGRREAAGDRVR